MENPSFFQIILLAVVQGITEFLPISSSAHLILVPRFFDWPDQGLTIDVAVHVGALGAVTLYFWRDFFDLARGGLALLRFRVTREGRMLLLLLLATVPVIIAGFGLNSVMPDGIRSPMVIAVTTIGFGALLFASDRWFGQGADISRLDWRGAVFIGMMQILALIPGTSRSGITMTAGRILGMKRSEAARFSLLLSFPAIAGAGFLKGLELVETGNGELGLAAAVAALVAFFTALMAITAMMIWLRKANFTPFVLYRLFLGLILLTMF